MIIADMMLLILALAATIAAAIADLKTREVPDWISYGLMISAGTVRLMAALMAKTGSYFWYGILGFSAMYLFGEVMFRTKQWGGGDAKLLMGLGIVFATHPFFIAASYVPFLVLFLVNCLLIGAVYGILYSIGLAWKERKKFVQCVKKEMSTTKIKQTRAVMVGIAIMLFFISIAIEDTLTKMTMLTITLLCILYAYFWVFIKSVENACLYRTVAPKQLTEGDWVEEDIKVKNKIIYKKKNIGIERADIEKLIRAKVKKVLVKDGIPFTPTFFFGIVLSLTHGGVIAFL